MDVRITKAVMALLVENSCTEYPSNNHLAHNYTILQVATALVTEVEFTLGWHGGPTSVNTSGYPDEANVDHNF